MGNLHCVDCTTDRLKILHLIYMIISLQLNGTYKFMKCSFFVFFNLNLFITETFFFFVFFKGVYYETCTMCKAAEFYLGRNKWNYRLKSEQIRRAQKNRAQGKVAASFTLFVFPSDSILQMKNKCFYKCIEIKKN